MTIDEAIETLMDLDTTLPQSDPECRREAVRLGIEALDHIRRQRQANLGVAYTTLKGETV